MPKRALKQNPPLIIWGNPGGSARVERVAKIGRQVLAVEYNHSTNGAGYRHDFDSPVEAIVVKIGNQLGILLLGSKGQDIAADR